MKWYFAAGLAVAALVFSATSTSAELGGVSHRDVVLERELALHSAVVGSRQELARFLASADEKTSPMAALAPKSREAFLDSLFFTPSGLASFRVDVLSGLKVAEAHRILSLFGMQHMLLGVPKLRAEDALDEAIMSYFQQPIAKCVSMKEISDSRGREAGIQGTCPGYKEGYSCAGTGSCVKSTDFICNLRTC